MTLSLRKIEEAARAATSGPWMQERRKGKDCLYRSVVLDGSYLDIATIEWTRREVRPGLTSTQPSPNSTHIANMDPDTVLALVAVVRKAMELSAVSGLRAEYMQDELNALNEALAPFEE